MANINELPELKEKLEQIKSDLSKKEGERLAVMEQLFKKFGVKELDDLYKKFDELGKKKEVKQEEMEELIADVSKRLREYGY